MVVSSSVKIFLIKEHLIYFEVVHTASYKFVSN